jgi:hypothetical protein
MNDPRRLLEAGATDTELALLRAGTADQPSEHAQANLILTLGLSSAVAAAEVAPKAVSGVSARMSTKLSAKWLVITAGTLALGTSIWLQSAHRPAPTPIKPSMTVPPIAAPRASLKSKPSDSTARPDADGPELATESEPAAAATKPAAPKSIAHEIALLDEARVGLAKQRPREALARLDIYHNQYPSGVLRQEATLLRIDALVGTHALPAARKLAQRYLAENPASPHRNRIQTLLSEKRDAP